VVAEMPSCFAEDFDRTGHSRFRHPSDISVRPHDRHYAYLTARAVAGTLSYGYVTCDPDWRAADGCAPAAGVLLNDTPGWARTARWYAAVRASCGRYFPQRSPFERTPA